MLKLIRTKGHFGRCPLGLIQKKDTKKLSDFEQEIVSFTLVQIFFILSLLVEKVTCFLSQSIENPQP